MSGFAHVWALLTQDAPALPPAWVMRLGLTLGWSLVLATLGAALACRLSLRSRRVLAAALAVWTLLPGPLSPDYWLGLAFHAPSLSAVLLCGWFGWRLLLAPAGTAATTATASASARSSLSSSPAAAVGTLASAAVWLWLAVLLGYVLLLDSFAVLPLQIYAWGFSPVLLLVLLALSLLPWLLQGRAEQAAGAARWLLPAALLLFAATRLPTGNLWDALLDPLLWLLLQGLGLRGLYRRWRA
jgi:hypothetical protein